MINFGDVDINKVQNKNKTNIDGVRVAFRKNDRFQAIECCKRLIDKGYLVFVQPMVTISYTDDEFKELIELANKMDLHAFYIVDSFGEMNEKDLVHFYSIAECNLKKEIYLGFHSHNNLQLAYSNCKRFACLESKHNKIIDTSIYGMGRGAGNLNTEIFLDYLVNEYNMRFNINPIIDAIDKVVNNFHVEHFWGYSIPYYISAKNHCHPNYASFLDNKKTLTFFDIEKIIKSIKEEKKTKYDKSYINDLYLEYQEQNDTSNSLNDLNKIFDGKNVVLIAPGSSINGVSKKIGELRRSGSVVVSVNFIPKSLGQDYAFFSNSKRFASSVDKLNSRIILTSNIETDIKSYRVSYFSLLNNKESVYDNAGLMAIKLMILLGVKNIILAGYDGYGDSPNKDYAFESLKLPYRTSNEYLNKPIKEIISLYKKQINIEFLTKSRYED